MRVLFASVLVDTNVLLRSVQPSHPIHNPADRVCCRLILAGEPVVITPQIVAEFWHVATRTAEQQALTKVVKIEAIRPP